jgi:hypothetical protein
MLILTMTNGLTSPVTDIDTVKQVYPEAALLVDLVRNVWNGHSPTVKIEFALSDRLKAKFPDLTGKDIQAVFITDSGARHIKKAVRPGRSSPEPGRHSPG